MTRPGPGPGLDDTADDAGSRGRGPLVGTRIGVSELRRRPGNRQEVRRRVELGELGTSAAVVEAPGLADYEVTMEALSDGVTVTGVLHVPWSGPCRRCLETTSGVVDAPIAEIVADEPVEGETWPFDGDAVELGPVLRDAAVLALPLAPLCREDCAGPDPEGFPVVTVDPEAPAPMDPRWAALSEVRFDDDGPTG